MQSFIKYRQLSEDFPSLKADASLQLTRLYIKLAERRTDTDSLQCMIKAYEASTQSKKKTTRFQSHREIQFRLGDDKKVENETSYKLGQDYVEHGDVDSALTYLHKYYDYCQSVNDDEGFGQASEALAICYQK
mgnify:CR=1 FL=1